MVSAATTRRREQLRDFLRSRRERIGPGEVGLPMVGRRRTPGLRREEVAMLAGVRCQLHTPRSPITRGEDNVTSAVRRSVCVYIAITEPV
jgi:hypothetical protein